ncbi:hypothetical protein [Paraflavitalea speifideaquila]|uniref:hypothetical protein n=1 Tax=Paraflavitalea speifideaquila TaxID=3076558 RepID=UPI0028EF5002|nr:hypothetical protein [Paraflavitalea speifideiaquila]
MIATTTQADEPFLPTDRLINCAKAACSWALKAGKLPSGLAFTNEKDMGQSAVIDGRSIFPGWYITAYQEGFFLGRAFGTGEAEDKK